ncbi:MAG TPA: signal recognition particle-docking protein FtsY [Actinomycetota bacterium]|nr:signal recognition particle-docking protein FtsY [Actinomycetota bacterium]
MLGLVGAVALRARRGGLRAARPAGAPEAREAGEGREARGTPTGAPRIPTGGLGARIRSLLGRETTEETWRELEAALVRADVGPRTAAALVARIRESYRLPDDPVEVVAREVAAVFTGDEPWKPPEGSPAVVMVVGVNGSGKTTTIGKLAHLLVREGHSVTLANSDTFRAAAAEQLETWARRAGAHVVSQARGADPGAVAFDAVQAARARGSDVLIVDTAGRLHTKQPLMEELRKVRRVLERTAGRVDEVLLVLDATTGQNGIAQARAFTEAVEVTGIVLAKMDGTARGGIVLAVREELGVPVKLVGVGESLEDLVPFDPEAFARRLLA